MRHVRHLSELRIRMLLNGRAGNPRINDFPKHPVAYLQPSEGRKRLTRQLDDARSLRVSLAERDLSTSSAPCSPGRSLI